MGSNHDFDAAAFSAVKDMMKERFGVLAEKYIRNANLYVQKAEQAVKAANAEDIVQNVHALKSSSAMLGFTGIYRCAEEMEDKARRGDVDLLEDMERLKDYLRHGREILAPYLEKY